MIVLQRNALKKNLVVGMNDGDLFSHWLRLCVFRYLWLDHLAEQERSIMSFDKTKPYKFGKTYMGPGDRDVAVEQVKKEIDNIPDDCVKRTDTYETYPNYVGAGEVGIKYTPENDKDTK